MLATLPSNSSFTFADKHTFFAFAAKFIVDTVYGIELSLEDRVAISTVRELPPSESLSILVMTESLYGMWVALLESFSMTMLRDVRDLLILEASLSLSPAAMVDFCFSEPARSTKCILEDFMQKVYEKGLFSRVVVEMVRME